MDALLRIGAHRRVGGVGVVGSGWLRILVETNNLRVD